MLASDPTAVVRVRDEFWTVVCCCCKAKSLTTAGSKFFCDKLGRGGKNAACILDPAAAALPTKEEDGNESEGNDEAAGYSAVGGEG